jgi:hypothetical protein
MHIRWHSHRKRTLDILDIGGGYCAGRGFAAVGVIFQDPLIVMTDTARRFQVYIICLYRLGTIFASPEYDIRKDIPVCGAAGKRRQAQLCLSPLCIGASRNLFGGTSFICWIGNLYLVAR